ncbi:CRISPR-associated protein, Cas1 family [Fervidobacterium changbaicum]|uniref:CRISPR-associated endonuclease Cas1 n=1 Tax=Fervidobacterium changbaicum TaxID=310769 RepID=A0ABX5QS95_9BACT|nr:type I-B CRISPR-associated endonuclease Cas1b [Fervidobacterium changbaicum]QAV33192.1 type I-B CRISPR-associated endonuclease Cas1 [Fervidobacterium changbaicum]SDH70521.1 CRISPR-associated protein, Cas1 family [Fervidobacterium changbaicum]
MQTVYIFRDAYLRKKSAALYIEPKSENEKPMYVPLKNVSSVMVFSEVELNKKTLELFSHSQIPVFFYNYYGEYIGCFYPIELNKTGEMLILQLQHYQDLEKRIIIAREILNGVADNMVNVLTPYTNKFPEVQKNIDKILALKKSYSRQDSIPALMAIEGNVRKSYYEALGIILSEKGFTFEERTTRPPSDEINALISFGNTILYNVVLSEIFKTSLEPSISFLHEPSKRKFSLQLDIAEIFKPIIVDKVILTVVNKSIIKKEDFRQVEGGVYLNENGKKKFIKELEAKIEETIDYENGQKMSFRTVIRHECYKLIRHLREEEAYKAFRM